MENSFSMTPFWRSLCIKCIFSISQKPLGCWLRFTAVLIYSMYPAVLASVLASRNEAAAARHAVTWADLAGANLYQPGNVSLPWAAFVCRILKGNARWLERVPFRAFWNTTCFRDVPHVSIPTTLLHFPLISMSQVNVNKLVLICIPKRRPLLVVLKNVVSSLKTLGICFFVTFYLEVLWAPSLNFYFLVILMQYTNYVSCFPCRVAGGSPFLVLWAKRWTQTSWTDVTVSVDHQKQHWFTSHSYLQHPRGFWSIGIQHNCYLIEWGKTKIS